VAVDRNGRQGGRMQMGSDRIRGGWAADVNFTESYDHQYRAAEVPDPVRRGCGSGSRRERGAYPKEICDERATKSRARRRCAMDLELLRRGNQSYAGAFAGSIGIDASQQAADMWEGAKVIAHGDAGMVVNEVQNQMASRMAQVMIRTPGHSAVGEPLCGIDIPSFP